MSGCSTTPAPPKREVSRTATPDAHPLAEAERIRIADELRSDLPCRDEDVWYDDMAFWDAMNGFDCFDPAGASFIRVYEHADSVAQVLQDWDGTLGTDRSVAFGSHWFVIGPRSAMPNLRSPRGAPQLESVSAAHPMTPTQDYLTTCIRFGAAEAQRFVRDPEGRVPDRKQYSTLFPAVTRAVHRAVGDLDPAGVTAVPDAERLLAALSAAGPSIKQACVGAAEATAGDVDTFGEANDAGR